MFFNQHQLTTTNHQLFFMQSVKEILNSHKAPRQHIAPILILAPTQRCGSTLIQRAINGGKEAVIYGENFFFMETLPAINGGPFQNFDKKLSITQATEKAFFENNAGIDATALFPHYGEYVYTLSKGFYDLLDFYQRFSESKGRKHWGFKHQIRELGGLKNTLTFMPNYKLIVVYRDILDVAKSHRARWPKELETSEQLKKYAERWQNNLEFLLGYQQTKMLLKYEDIIKTPDETVSNLSKFLGVQIDRAAFDKKVNSEQNPQDVMRGNIEEGIYIQPASLTNEEETLLRNATSVLRSKLGYE